jgi:RNA polymerase sigma-70 factor (ECF subfamily)
MISRRKNELFGGWRRPMLLSSYKESVMSDPRDSDGPEVSAESSDRSLLWRVKKGSADAATELYLRYAGRLGALARAKSSRELAVKISPEEIVQSVFGSFFRGTKNGCYDIPAGEELWGLFLVIALNKIRNKGAFYLAAKRDSRITKGNDELEAHAGSFEDDDQFALKILEISIGESLEDFPDNYRQIVDLRVQGYEIEEIAARTKHSKRTVERIMQEVRKKLAHLMDEQ